MIVCITITNAKDYFPKRSTNGDSRAVIRRFKLTKPAVPQHKETDEEIHHTGVKS